MKGDLTLERMGRPPSYGPGDALLPMDLNGARRRSPHPDDLCASARTQLVIGRCQSGKGWLGATGGNDMAQNCKHFNEKKSVRRRPKLKRSDAGRNIGIVIVTVYREPTRSDTIHQKVGASNGKKCSGGWSEVTYRLVGVAPPHEAQSPAGESFVTMEMTKSTFL